MEQFINLNPKTLGTAITTTFATSMTLSDVTGLPSDGNCRGLIDDEYILVTLNGTGTVTIARGIEGSTAATHSSGADVKFVLTNGALLKFREESVQMGPYGSRPTPGNTGLLYFDTDAPTFGRDNGSAFDNFFPPFGKINPPDLTAFTSVGYAASASTSRNVKSKQKGPYPYIYYDAGNGGSHNVGGWVMPVNASNTVDWTATFGCTMNSQTGGNMHAGICAYESSSGKLIGYGPRNAQTTFEQLVQYATSGTSSSSSSSFGSQLTLNTVYNINDYKFFQIRYRHNNSTTELRTYASIDGLDWGITTIPSYSSMTVSTIDYVGFFLSTYTNNSWESGNDVGMDAFHWSYTEP